MKTRYAKQKEQLGRRRPGLGEWRFDHVRSQRGTHRLTTASADVLERPAIDKDPQRLASAGWIVTVFDNDYNTYEQVLKILMIATGCTAEEAYLEAWEIDHLGKSVVHYAAENECREAAELIAKIGIRVEVSEE